MYITDVLIFNEELTTGSRWQEVLELAGRLFLHMPEEERIRLDLIEHRFWSIFERRPYQFARLCEALETFGPDVTRERIQQLYRIRQLRNGDFVDEVFSDLQSVAIGEQDVALRLFSVRLLDYDEASSLS